MLAQSGRWERSAAVAVTNKAVALQCNPDRPRADTRTGIAASAVRTRQRIRYQVDGESPSPNVVQSEVHEGHVLVASYRGQKWNAGLVLPRCWD